MIGDTILDIYSYGQEVCKSSDSQAIEAEEEKISITFGGASLVASNILELGGRVIFFSVVGDDPISKHYDFFTHPKLNKNFLVDKNRPTTVKKRFWVDGRKVFQINQVDNQDISSNLEKELIAKIESCLSEVDLIVALDARHGLLTKNLISQLIRLAKRHQKPLYVDSQISHKNSNHYLYRRADCFFLNRNEAKAILPDFNMRRPKESLKLLKENFAVNNVVIKLGGQGSVALFNNKYIRSPAYRVKALDPCGAGDAFLACFCLGSREAPEESLAIANVWAALSTTIRGTNPPKKQALIHICYD